MTREETEELLTIIQAWLKGKQIQYRNHEGNWEDLRKDFCPIGYVEVRIKPEPKYRPFQSKEECWNEMQKHQPFGWVCHDYNYHQILVVGDVGIRFVGLSLTFDQAVNDTFADGTPFGVKED